MLNRAMCRGLSNAYHSSCKKFTTKIDCTLYPLYKTISRLLLRELSTKLKSLEGKNCNSELNWCVGHILYNRQTLPTNTAMRTP